MVPTENGPSKRHTANEMSNSWVLCLHKDNNNNNNIRIVRNVHLFYIYLSEWRVVFFGHKHKMCISNNKLGYFIDETILVQFLAK